MKKFVALVISIGVLLSLPHSLFARDFLDAVFGNNGLFHTAAKATGQYAFYGPKLASSFVMGNYERDYGYDGYRHGGYTHEYDYGHNASGDNGYGYCHHGMDHNRFSGV
ncbi:MAG TPA: hypothetical protein P5287_08115 [bacterium]|nr:hypothetical protein [bacterium]